jgi:rhodanese-related sulfurtransferase
MTRAVSVAELRQRLAGADELALVDVREQGVHYRGHPFFAVSLPLSRLEMRVADLVPRRSAPVVVLDGGAEGLAEKAAARLARLGYTDVAVLQGGCAAWKAAGGELFSGVNVPSKAFGEFVEHHYETPRVTPQELKALQAKGKVVILDSRPYDEYHRMNIPGGIDAPGAELVYRVHDLAPDPDTLVVVNCAGRTRSIIGCQSLRNAGIPNTVVALKDGTMGWDLAGLQCERGSTRIAPPPSPEGLAKAQEAADRVGRRFGVKFLSFQQMEIFGKDEARTLYLLDVRTKEEFEARRLAGSRHAPGGQLVQATDEYVAVRNSRIVLVDPQRVRSVMTASWLNQMGWDDVHVLEPEGADGFGNAKTDAGVAQQQLLEFHAGETVTPQELQGSKGATVLDLSTSLRFRARHVPGAWWGVRSRLAEAKQKLADAKSLVLTSEDGNLAHYAASEAAVLWPQANVRVLKGGNAAWFDAGLAVESGMERATTALDDVAYKAYDHAKDYEKHAREYLSWEVALVDQIAREPAVRFRKY